MSEEAEELPNEEAEIEPQNEPENESAGPSSEELNDSNSEYWQERAKKDGWNPDGKGRGAFSKSAREFVNDGALYAQIETLSEKTSSIENRLNEKFQVDFQMQRTAHESRIQELESTRDSAIDEADKDAALKAQGQIDNLTQQINQIDAVPQRQTSNANVQAFEAQNPWLADANNTMSPNFQKATIASQTYNSAIARGADPDTALAALQVAISQMPETNTMRNNASQVESGKRPGKRGARDLTYDQLPAQAQRDITIAVDHGFYTHEEALKQYNSYRKEG